MIAAHTAFSDELSPGLERSLRHLRDFLAVADAGSVAGASTTMFKASSAVARAIGELESALGVALFERKPRGMLLNRYGEAARDRARRIMAEISDVTDDLCRPGKRQTPTERNAVMAVLLSGRSLLLMTTLADVRSLSVAATQVGLSQSGASMALSRLEDTLTQPLFQRMSQGMVATDIGAKLVSRGKRILAELRHMAADIAAISGTVQGTITIGALPLARTFVLPTALAAAVKAHPHLRISTVESPYETLAAGLRDGDIDFILGALRETDKSTDLVTEPLFEDRMGILVRAGHPLVGKALALADLLDLPWILPRPSAPGRHLIDLSFRALGVVPPVPVVETGDLAVLRGLLQSSDMLTALSPHQLHYEIAAGELVELAIPLGTTVRRIGLTIRRGALLSPAAEAVLGEIRRVAAARAACGEKIS